MSAVPLETALHPTGSSSTGRAPGWALTPLALAVLMPSLDTSIANAGLPALARAFGASFQGMQWVVLSYLLTITALIVSAGRLGDLVGRRRLFLGGIALFTAASLLCGAAPSLPILLAGRALQGFGAAVMLSLAFALVGEAVPARQTGRGMGLLGAMSAIGMTLGPSLGGLLIASFGWPSIFFINLPVGLVTFLLAVRLLPADARPAQGSFDLAGTLLLTTTLTSYALALTVGAGHFGWRNVALLLAAIAAGGVFAIVESRVASPMIHPGVFRDARLRTGLATSILVMTVLMTTLVVGPFHLARGLGLDARAAGLALSVGPLAAALSSLPAGRLVDRFGASHLTLAGLGGLAIGAALLALLPGMFGLAGYLGPVVVITSSYALFQTANNTALMAGAPGEQRGVVAGLIALSRHLGQISGAALMGAVFTVATGSADIAAVSPDTVTTGMRITFAAAIPLILAAVAITLRGRRAS